MPRAEMPTEMEQSRLDALFNMKLATKNRVEALAAEVMAAPVSYDMDVDNIDPVADTLLNIYDEADANIAALRLITEDEVVSKIRQKPTP
ncbi:hypothetical protein [Brevibacterium permense]|uniref:Uncharacterized protein n=1 Tax=Brevibacterium permense TaxID=234834 RepID=A0ABP4L0V7_9MICO|nr:hypothetical protein [Brevibacterium permense]